MAWESHRRHAYIPVAVRRAVYHRADGICEARYRGCLHADRLEYHHVIGVEEWDGPPEELNALGNVALLCHSCHNLETQRQASKARNAWKLEPEVNPANRR